MTKRMIHWALLLLLALSCSACGGGPSATPAGSAAESDSSTAVARTTDASALDASTLDDTSSLDNSPNMDIPVLTGNPATSTAAGAFYDFAPGLLNAPSTPVSFSILNKPDWAVFDPMSGELYGTPTSDQAGVYAGIEITASYAQGTATLAAFSISVLPATITFRSVTISWTAPEANIDATPLTDLAGYRVYYRRYADQGWGVPQMVTVPGGAFTSITLQNLLPGTYRVSVTAYNSANVESDPAVYPSEFVL